MTLEGGGGGGIVSAITDPISSALGTDGGGGGILGALADVDKAVGDTVPGGWGTIAAVAVPYLAPELIALQAGTAAVPLTAGQAAAVAAGTSAATGAIRGDDPEDILKNAALAGGTSYGLNTLFGDAGYIPDEGSPYIDGTPPPSYRPNYVPDEGSPYIDGTPPPNYSPPPSYTPDEASPYIDGTPPADVIPPDLSVFNPYIDSPDGLTQLGYSPDQLAAITSSSTPSTLSQEEQYEKFYKEFLNNPQNPRPGFFQDPLQNITNKASDTYDYLRNAPENAYKYLRDTPIKEMGSDLYDFAGRNKLELGLGALALSSMGGQQPQPQGQPTAADSRYTGGYGSSGGVASPYLLRNRVTASNIYDYENPYDRYATVNSRYAKGGEVKHFAFGGISNAITRFTQPIEKAIVQPIGQALPFLKDVAPYAGILAAPFIANPAMAVGVGALSSGFGRPGTGFDMKRALMGGIAAYGASTLGAGLEAAGATPTVATPTLNLDADVMASTNAFSPQPTSLENAISKTEFTPKSFFRDTDAMQKGVGNLLSSNSDAATKAFATQAGTFKSGIPLVMGTSGMMAIDEANKMREEAERSAGVGRQEQADMLARISKGRKRAEEAVRANPYMYAEGGPVPGIASQLGGSMSKFEPGNGPPPGMTWSETQGKFMPSDSVVGAMPSGNMPLPQQQPYMPIVGNQGMRLNQREYEMANPDKPTDLDYKSGSPTSNLPPGFIPPDGPATAALEDFYNPQTKQRVTVGSGGYTPASGFYNVTGLPVNRYPTPTVRPPDAATGYRPPPIPQNQFLIERMLNNRNIYSQPPSRMQPIPMGGLSSLMQRQRFMPRRTFAMGGQVDDELGGDYSAMGMDQGNMQKGLFGIGYAECGTPRFLSGGGDGMSDSIPATIGGTQEARLADGEFVIPADVVSHLGNGSSKAGAKQLYSMMDRVRKARTGNEKQGRQIKPTKLMPA